MEQIVGNSTNYCNLAVEMKNSTEMKKLPEVDESKLGGNPFTQELRIPVTEIVSKVDLQRNEEGVIINKVLYTEKIQKVELYYHTDAGNNIAGLSDKAQRLLLHILYTLRPKKDYIQLNTEHYMMRNEIRSLTTVSNAITELIRYEYIVRSCLKGVYWINPHRFFPGSRLMKYPDNKVILQKWDQTDGEADAVPKTKKKIHRGLQMTDEQREIKEMETEYRNNKNK